MNDTPKQKTYRAAIRRPVTTAMVFLTLVVFGWKSYRQLPINLMPDISYPTLTVRTEYEGAAPEDVETFVTRPLEETLSIVSGMVEISSISSPGLSEIILEFAWDTDMNIAQQDVRDRLDLFEPPREVTEKPVILRYDPRLDPVMRVALTGPDVGHSSDAAQGAEFRRRQLTAIREAAERYVKSDLEAEAGIAQVVVKGGNEEEIQVLVDADRLKNLGLSLESITNSLSQQNINLSGGRLKEGKTEYLVRTLNEYQDIEEIQDGIITTVGTSQTALGAAAGVQSGQTSMNPGTMSRQIRLADVATVSVGEKERETIVHVNGQPAVALDLYKDGDANTVQICKKLKDIFGFERKRSFTERLAVQIAKSRRTKDAPSAIETGDDAEQLTKTIRSRLPQDTSFWLITDQSRFITASIEEVQKATIYGGILALLVLFLFLRELKSTLVIGIAIPISVISAFIPMFMRSISLNIMSLGGLALGVGMLVDNSIVVLESIFRCREEGDAPVDAAERGTAEVSRAVTSSTLTTIAVFFPIAFVEGVAGQIFGDLALTVTFSLLASLLVALYLNPMMVSRARLALAAGQEVVWLLRAYRHARRDEGRGMVAAVLRLGPIGLQYARAWLRQTARDDLGPLANSIRAAATTPTVVRILACIVRCAFSPVTIALFAFMLALKLAGTTLVTVVFVITLALAAVLWTVRALIRLVLWLPLHAFDAGFGAVRRGYALALRAALNFSPLVLILVLLTAVHAAKTATTLGRELIPPFKQGEFGIRMEAPPGTRLEETEELADRIERLIMATPEVDSVSVEIGVEKSKSTGNRGENIAQFSVLLENPREAAQYQDAVIERLRRKIAAISSEQIAFTLPTLFSFKTAVELQIRGDELEELRRVGNDVLAAVKDVKGLKDAELSVKKGYPEIIIELDRDLLATKGLTPIQVAERLRREVQGDVATRFSRSGEKVDIRVRSNKELLSSLQDLRMVSVVDGHPPLPLESVAAISVQDGPSEVRRIDQRQVVVVQGNVEGIDLGGVSREIEERLRKVAKPKDYAFFLGGQNRELQTSYTSLQFALLLAVFLVYVVMASQFESLVHPAFVMFAVPLAFVGVIYTLQWLSISLSVVVFIGGIVLAGIIVNDAIVLVDYINQLRARGLSKREAVIQAGQVRLRPIIMTTVTTVLGLIPMALWTGEGAEMRRPLAITVMAGLSSATVLTLFVIPMVYDLFGGRDRR